MTATPKLSSRTRHGLIALIALRQARIMRERREREAADRKAKADAAPKRKRGWLW